jgi:CheY-like chemotaxis protein
VTQRGASIPLDVGQRIAGRRLLIVDDNATNRSVLQEHLRLWGLVSEASESGPDALARLRERADRGEPFDGAILDLMMPGMDGLELARAIRADARFARLPLVLLTSLHVSARDAEGAGVVARLTKPVRRSELYNAVVEALCPAFGEPDQPEDFPTTGRPNTRNLRVLLVEDNAVNQRVALAMLKRLGCEVEVAETGPAAIDAVARCGLDLVLMDVQLPEMDGLQATRRIRAAQSGPVFAAHIEGFRLPIVALTAHAGKDDREECLAAGMDDWLPKPFSLEQLERMLRRWAPRAERGKST